MVRKSRQWGCGCGPADHIPATVRKPSDECPRSTPFLLSLQPRTQTHGSTPPTLGRSSHFKEHSHHSPSQCAWSLACWEIPNPVKLMINMNHHMPMFIFDLVTKLRRPLSTQWAGHMQILTIFIFFLAAVICGHTGCHFTLLVSRTFPAFSIFTCLSWSHQCRMSLGAPSPARPLVYTGDTRQ